MNFKDLQIQLDYRFQNIDLLKAALIHPSHRQSVKAKPFQRFEFLGDRVLGLVIAHYLFENHQREKEGDLAKRLAVLVSRDVCHDVALALKLPTYLATDGPEFSANSSVHADAMEALIGAVYLDGGMDVVKTFILKHWGDRLTQDRKPPRDPKTTLQEWAQAKYKIVPTYTLLNMSGPDHAPVFEVVVQVQGDERVTGVGASKKQAERNAAQNYLEAFSL